MTKANKPEDVFKFISMGEPDECWLWNGSISRKGVPYFTVDGRKIVAYRLVKWLTEGNFNLYDERIIPLHQCKGPNGEPIDNPLCCNPAHTRMGTHQENTLDMMLRGRAGLTREAVSDILSIREEFPQLSHGQIAARIEFKHKIKCARQTVTDILNQRRRSVLQEDIRKRNAAIEESGHGTKDQSEGEGTEGIG